MIRRIFVNRKAALGLFAVCLAATLVSSWLFAQSSKKKPQRFAEGYTDTAFLPGGEWRVHDLHRPHPGVITPGGKPAAPPSDAIVLFDGKDLSHWITRGKRQDQGKTFPAQWKLENGYIEVVPGTGDLVSKEEFGDCQIHVEWASPAKVTANSQGRGNSGVLMMTRYEIQVLDSYQNITYADGQAASMYGQYPPLVNACRKPGEWQAYDIIFEVPVFDGKKLLKPAYVTVLHNGVVVHNHQAFLGPMRHKILTRYEPHGPKGPLMLQSHNNPTRYRNIWVRPLKGYDEQ